MNVLAYADDIVLIVGIENIARNLGLHKNEGKTKCKRVEWKKSSKQNKKGQLTIKNYIYGRVEIFKYLGVIFNEDNNQQTDLQKNKQS